MNRRYTCIQSMPYATLERLRARRKKVSLVEGSLVHTHLLTWAHLELEFFWEFEDDITKPKLYNINLHNITHSLISQNPRERTFVVQISLFNITCFSLILHFCHKCNLPKKSTHTLALRHVCGVSPSSSSSSATCWMLVHAYAISPMKVKGNRPHQRSWEENEFKFHSVTCYTNYVLSRIHVNTTKLRNITCTLVATGVIQRSLECSAERAPFCGSHCNERNKVSFSYSPLTHTGAGHQWTVSTNISCNQWLSLAEPGLKAAHAGRNRSLVTWTSMCGCAIN